MVEETTSHLQMQFSIKKDDLRDKDSDTGGLEFEAIQLDGEKFGSQSEMTDKNPLTIQKMTIFQSSLSMVAASIGGGLLGMPYAIYHLGLFCGLACIVLLAALSHFSNIMHLKVKDLTPRRYESIYEIAYLLLGRPSIFVVTIILLLTNLCSCIMYYMVVGTTVSMLIT